MFKSSMSAIIVAKPSRRRDSLRAVLRAIPQLRIISQVDDCPSALKMVSKHLVKLMLLDSNLDDEEIRITLQQVKTKWPQTRCLVLVETALQQNMAKAAGADDVLISGFSITDFLQTIEKLLAENHTTHQKNEGIQTVPLMEIEERLVGVDQFKS